MDYVPHYLQLLPNEDVFFQLLSQVKCQAHIPHMH